MSYRIGLQVLVVFCLVTFLPGREALATGIHHGGARLSLSLTEVLDSEESFSVEGSLISFRDFELTLTGGDVDLDLLRIVFDDSGFKLKGPLKAKGGDVVEIVLDYVVESEQNLITGATLGVMGLALGRGAEISVSESFEQFPEDGLEASIDHGLDRERDHASFGDGALSLNVSKNILLETAMAENASENGYSRNGHCGFHCRYMKKRWMHLSLTRVFSVEQRFKIDPHPIPEPSTALLLGIAMLSLGALRARGGL